MAPQPAHLNLLLPEAKGVVAVKPRRTDKKYSDNPWENEALNEGNRLTYFVIRNGEKVWLHCTDFEVGARLVPTRDEFTSLFRKTVHNHTTGQSETVDLEPGSDDWLKAEKASSARNRHFMRIALILQGLIDRTTVFHPIAPNTSLLHPEAYESGVIVLVTDDEMALGTGREPYYDWIRRLNRELRPGMRIIGNFGHSDFRGLRSNERFSYDEHPRLTPKKAVGPDSMVIHYLDGRKSGGFTFKYKRNEKVWDPKVWVPSPTRPGYGNYGEERAPKNRATCVVMPDDKFIIPIDLVTIEEMETYLNARTERHAYADMMPLLNAAIAVKKAEVDAEAPFRDLIARQIASEYGIEDPATLTTDVTSLVDWWKLANTTHRPLVASAATGTTDESKALRMIVAEWDRRRRAAANSDDEAEAKAVAHLRAEDPTIMYVGRARDGKVVAFAPQPTNFPTETIGKAVYVREYKVGITLRGKTQVRDWVLPATRTARMITLFEDETWTGWDRAVVAKNHLTDPQLVELGNRAVDIAIDRVTNGVKDRMDRSLTEGQPAEVFAVTHDPKNRQIEVFLHPTTLPFDPKTPVTASESNRANYLVESFRWEFTSDKFMPELKRRSSNKDAWRADPFTKGQPLEMPWHVEGSRYRRPGLVAFDQDVFDQAMAARSTIAARNELVDARRRLVTNAYFNLQADWDKKVEAEQYARFIDDYADASLWEGHKKTLKSPHLPVERSNGRNRGDHFFREDFHSILTYLVDRYIDFDGMTLPAITALATTHGAGQWTPPESIAAFTIDTTNRGKDA